MGSVLPESSVATCDLAHAWGLEDALEGLRPRAADYFWSDTPQWTAYAEGYQAGIELLFRLTGSRSARQVGIATAPSGHPPHDFLTDEEDRHRERRF